MKNLSQDIDRASRSGNPLGHEVGLKKFLRQFAHAAAVALAVFSASLSAETFTNKADLAVELSGLYYTTEEDVKSGVPPFDATQIGTYKRGSGTGVPETSLYFDDLNPTVGFVGALIGSITPTSDLFTNPYPRFISGGHLDAVSLYTQTVDVTTANNPPVGVEDAANTVRNTSVNINVLGNDSDVDGDTLAIVGLSTDTINYSLPVSLASGAEVRVDEHGTPGDTSDDFVVYTPATDFVGTDVFRYRLSDGTDTVDVVVNVVVTEPLPVNSPPVAQPDTASTTSGTAVDINVLANDSDIDPGTTLSISGFTQPSQGTVIAAGTGLQYQPNADAAGTDSFTYTVSDGALQATATVTVTILAPEVAPLVDARDALDPVEQLLASASEPTAAGATTDETLLILSTHEDSVIEYCLGAICSVTSIETMEVNPNDIIVVNVTTDLVTKALEGDFVFVNQPNTDIDAVYYTVGSSGSSTVVFSVDSTATVWYAIDAINTDLPAGKLTIDSNDLVQCLLLVPPAGAEVDASLGHGKNLANCSVILDPDGVKTPDLQIFALSGIDVNGIHIRESSLGSDVVDSRCPEELSSGVVNLEWCPILLTVDTPTDAEAGLTITGSTTGNRFTEKVIVQSTSGALEQFDDLATALHGDVGREQLYGFFLAPDGEEIQFLVNRTDQVFLHNAFAEVGQRQYTSLFLSSDEVAEPHPHDVNIDALHVSLLDGTSYFSVEQTITAGETTLQPDEVWNYDPDGSPAFTLFFTEPSGINIDAFAFLDEAAGTYAYSRRYEPYDPDGGEVYTNESGSFSGILGGNVFASGGQAGAPPEIDGISFASDGTLFLTVENDGTKFKKGEAVNKNEVFALTTFQGNATPQRIFAYYNFENQLDTNVERRPFVTGGRNLDGISIGEGGAPPTSIDRFRIEPVYGGTAMTCEPDRIRIIAEVLETVTGPYVTATDFDGEITISTTSGNDPSQIAWSIPAADDPLYPKNPDFFTDNGDGTASYRFVLADEGQLVVDLAFPYEELISIEVNNVDATDARLDPATAEPGSADPPRNFAKAGLQFYEGDGRLRTQIAGKTSNELPNGGGMSLRVVADDGSGACVAACSGSIVTEFAYDCVNPVTGLSDPASCSGLSVDINGTAINQRAAGYTPTVLAFAGVDTARARFEFEYRDAAKLRLWARITGETALRLDAGLAAVDASVNGVSCAANEGHSNDFVVRPFAFGFSDIAAGDGARAISASNPGGTAEAGNGFVSAGSKFDSVLSAYVWDATDDLGTYDIAGTLITAGQPDGHPDPDVDVTRYPGSVPTAKTIQFFQDATLVDLAYSAYAKGFTPAGGVLGALTDPEIRIGKPDGTMSLRGQTYSEVGSIRMLVQQLNYLNAGQYPDRSAGQGWPDPDVRGFSPVIGRFFPDQFSVLPGSGVQEITTCTTPDDPAFVYMDEDVLDVSLDLAALNAFGNVTTNYSLSKGYAESYLATPILNAENDNGGVDLADRLILPSPGPSELGYPATIQSDMADRIPVEASSWGSPTSGEGVFTYFSSGNKFRRPMSPEPDPDGPYSSLQTGLSLSGVDTYPDAAGGARIEPQDMNSSDSGDCIAATNCDSTAMAGTLDIRYGRANMKDGAGSSAKPIALPVNMEFWDGTRFTLNEADNCTLLGDGNFLLNARDDEDPAAPRSVAGMQAQVDAGFTNGEVNGLSSFSEPVVKGDLGLVFTPPGSGNTGYVDVKLQAIAPWLLYDYTPECGVPEACAEIYFGGGARQGDDNVIYWEGR